MSEPRGHWQIYDSSVALTLTFLRRSRGNTERNVRVAIPEDGTDFSSHAAGAPFDIAWFDRRGLVVACRSDCAFARAARPQRKLMCVSYAPFRGEQTPLSS